MTDQVVVPPSMAHPGIVTTSGHHGYHDRHRGLEGKDAVHLHSTQTSSEARNILQQTGAFAVLAQKDRADQERFLAAELSRTQRDLAALRESLLASQKTVELTVRDDGEATRNLIRDQETRQLAKELAEAKQELMIRRLCPAPTPV